MDPSKRVRTVRPRTSWNISPANDSTPPSPHPTSNPASEIASSALRPSSLFESLPKYLMTKRVSALILNLTDEELTALQFLGPNAIQEVIDFIAAIKRSPSELGWVNVLHLQCLSDNRKPNPTAPASPTSPSSSEATLLSHFSNTTTVVPDLVSPFERVHFYTGISLDHPLLTTLFSSTVPISSSVPSSSLGRGTP
ncbi:hypothetical protein PQX77_009063 [Marasmius sp. AFHP31]|nr:hypothetical protein PQX77_009063 [Marasmius sp. AFHP31]